MPFRHPDEGTSRAARAPAHGVERWLRKIFVEDWNLKLLALAITLGLWYGVTGQRTPVTVRLRGVQLIFRLPTDMEISNEPPKEVEVTLTGNKRTLDAINARDLVAYVDVSERKPGERAEQLTPRRIKIELPEGVRVEDIKPNKVPLHLEPRVEREIEVEVRRDGKLPEGYDLLAVKVSPDKVKVRGPASHISLLTKAPTEIISLDGHRESFNATQTAIDIPDQKIDVLDTVVNVYLEIGEQRIEKTFAGIAVRISSGVQAQPARATATLYGPRSAIEKLRADDLQLLLEASADGAMTPRLVLPSGLEGRVELRSTKPASFSIK